MDAVAEIKARLNIEDVVSEYVQLKRSGRNFKGLSPWTNEKTPSFMVSPEKQIWHDFSSGKGGDVFSFVMEMEGLDFKATLELLARKAGVELEQFRSSAGRGNAELKARLRAANDLAARFYHKQLTVNRKAWDYLTKARGFSKKTLADWRFGYAPNSERALSKFLGGKGFSEHEIKQAGLSTQRRNGVGDMFRGRIMIPLANAQGEIVGFTARLLERDAYPSTSSGSAPPKYINTPATLIYDKSRQVFGLHLAKEAIRKSGLVVVTEGNMDVIASHQAGVTNVVASAGTAMTEQHLRELKRFTGDIRLSFDADSAGLAATERMIPLAQKLGVSLKIISTGTAKDPDELINNPPAGGVKKWQAAIEQAVYATDWLIERYKEQLDLSSAQGKKQFSDTLLTTIRRLGDPVEQEHYLKQIAELTDSSLAAIKAKLTHQPSLERVVRRKTATPAPVERGTLEYQRLQDHLLAMVLAKSKLRPVLDALKPVHFTAGPARRLFEFLQKNPKFVGGKAESRPLRDIADYVKILLLQFEELYKDLDDSDLADQATSLQARLLAQYIKIEKQKLAAAMAATEDDKTLADLLKKADALNKLVNSNK